MTLAAIVLAAGSGKRFGGDKLATSFRGEPLVFHAIRAARAAPVERVVVVAAPGLDTGEWPGQPAVQTIRLRSSELSTSLRAGVTAAGDADGVFVFLGDMPLVPHELAGQLSAMRGESFAAIPRYAGRSGHPVLLSARAFDELAHLSGDEGAGRLLRGRGDIAFLDVADEGCVEDVDQVTDLARLQGNREKG